MMFKFMEIKSNEPKLTQKQVCNQLSCSDSTIERYRDDISVDSPYKRNKDRKKNRKSNSTVTQSQNQSTNENTRNKKNTKSNEKNELKIGSVFENNQEDDNKFITIAGRMVDNVEDLHSLNE